MTTGQLVIRLLVPSKLIFCRHKEKILSSGSTRVIGALPNLNIEHSETMKQLKDIEIHDSLGTLDELYCGKHRQ